MRAIPINKKYLTACILLSLLMCAAQITGVTLAVVACLGLYMILVAISCCYDFTLPILLFFMPWSPVLRTNPSSFSFYTFGMVLICLISVIKRGFNFRNYQLKAGIMLLLVSLFAKLLSGNALAFSYIAFIMMIFLYPGVKEEWWEGKYDFYQLVTFFSWGVIISAICALNFAEFANIRRFIKVDGFAMIIRRSGFYGDANFYTAHILSAIGGVLALILQEKKKGRLAFLGMMVALLVYCGFLSASKSFVLVIAAILFLWIIALLKVRGRAGLKLIVIFLLIAGVIFIATSALFSGLIEVLLMRFSFANDLNSFTTGRIDIWRNYLEEMLGNAEVFFLGKGFTDVKVKGRASHNTIIQIFYQFGLIGAPMMLYWITCFFREAKLTLRAQKALDLKKMIVMVGSFLPWMAIDVLFADEFFLLQWYVLVAMNYLTPGKERGIEEIGLDGGELWTRE